MGKSLAALKAEGKRISEEITSIAEKVMDGDGGVKLATDSDEAKRLTELGAELKHIESMTGTIEGAEVFMDERKASTARVMHPVQPTGEKSLAEQILGDRAEYKGVDHFLPTLGGHKLEGTQHKTAFTSSSSADGALLPAAQRIEPWMPPVRRLTVRDAFFMPGATGAPMVEYHELTTDTNSASGVAEGGAKPEDAFLWTKRQKSVETVATTLPVTNQMLADYPSMVTMIQGRMGYHVDYEEERQLVWGTGSDELTGILNTTGVVDGSARITVEADDTYLDIIRKLITVAWSGTGGMAEGYYPTAVGVSPLVKQTIDLVKGDDLHYVFAVVQNAAGVRVWGLDIVESNAFRDPSDLNDHYMMVGSKAAGQIWDRESLNFAVGLVNDDFKKNKQTLRVEKRLASGLYSPSSFVYYEIENAS